MAVVPTKKELHKVLSKFNKKDNLGLVPTMGALHQGHASLIKRAVTENKNVVVTIFVNPTQFNNAEDLDKYPNTLKEDLELIYNISKDVIVFTPSVTEIYEKDIKPRIYNFNGLDEVMEGAFRENHFNGVGTIVEEILTLIKPTNAYFGEKDFQQLSIIRLLAKTKELPVNIIGCEIIREEHGLAMSSRNERLSNTTREKANFIYHTLQAAKEKFGTKNAVSVKEWVVKEFQQNKDFELEYFEITDSETLTPTINKEENTKYRGFIAVYAEDVRLIDNIALN